MKRILVISGLILAAVAGLVAQVTRLEIVKSDRPVIAVPDFKGSGGAAPFMDKFNETLWSELENSGVLKLAPKSMYPLQVPQQPGDFKQPSNPTEKMNGLWPADWAAPPVSSQYLAMGYTSVSADQIVLQGWLYSTAASDAQTAQIAKRYFGPVSSDGARKVAMEFAADIMAKFGGKSLMGSKIIFVSDRTGNKEIWQMNYDGSEQRPVTSYKSISSFPAASPDGSKVAFTTWKDGTPQIYVHSLESGRRLVFYNQRASMNTSAEFMPNGSGMLFSSTAAGGSAQIFATSQDGSNVRRVSSSRAIEVEPKVNPKTGRDIVFVSGRTGIPQIYRMNGEGGDVEQLTPGDGEAVNPAWHPDGQKLAFAWTKGFSRGNFNIFLLDVASKQYVQLTHGSGRNENPTWASDGLHLAFTSKRGPKSQIFVMLADGTNVRQLTSEGSNEKPVWVKGVN